MNETSVLSSARPGCPPAAWFGTRVPAAGDNGDGGTIGYRLDEPRDPKPETYTATRTYTATQP